MNQNESPTGSYLKTQMVIFVVLSAIFVIAWKIAKAILRFAWNGCAWLYRRVRGSRGVERATP